MSFFTELYQQLFSPQIKQNYKIEAAFWRSKFSGIVFLNQDWVEKSSLPPLRIKSGNPLTEIARIPPNRWGIFSCYKISNNTITFILHSFLFPDLVYSSTEKFYVAGNFNNWAKAIHDPKWELKKDKLENCLTLTVPLSYCITNEGSSAYFKFVSENQHWLEPPNETINIYTDESNNKNILIDPRKTGNNAFSFICKNPHTDNIIEEIIWDEKTNLHSKVISPKITFALLFNDMRLGAYYDIQKNESVFHFFAPRAKKVHLQIFEQGAKTSLKEYELSPLLQGFWELKIPKNLHGAHYNYFVTGNNIDNFTSFFDSAILDPYAKACASPNGPAIFIDENKIKTPCKKFTPASVKDIVISEVHLRDLIAKLPGYSSNKKIGFKELAEWIRSKDCYLKNLGINAIELQPIQEFDAISPENYHWGYMTNNWFSPASSYTKNPQSGSQIEEFRDLINAFHEQGFTVILDVVYNHVGEPNHLFRIDKEYFFTLDFHGNFTNWSGCGNDFNTKYPMARKLIIDSLIWLIEFYSIDGFRFDLAELIGASALRSIEIQIKKTHPETILIAEPWSFRGHIAHDLKSTQYSSWNDGFRDYIAKYVHNAVNTDGFKYFIAGSPKYLSSFPAQTINYTESHDDRCWLDKITECGNSNAEIPTQNDIKRTHLMFAFLLSSLGTPMIAEGQDFLRTKHGKNNTYLDGEENALNYKRLNTFKTTHLFVSKWIKFRLSKEGQLFRPYELVSENFFKFFTDTENKAILTIYNADYSIGNLQYILILNPKTTKTIIQLPYNIFDGFKQIANSTTFSKDGVPPDKDFITEQGFIKIPPLSCSFWIKNSSK